MFLLLFQAKRTVSRSHTPPGDISDFIPPPPQAIGRSRSRSPKNFTPQSRIQKSSSSVRAKSKSKSPRNVETQSVSSSASPSLRPKPFIPKLNMPQLPEESKKSLPKRPANDPTYESDSETSLDRTL